MICSNSSFVDLSSSIKQFLNNEMPPKQDFACTMYQNAVRNDILIRLASSEMQQQSILKLQLLHSSMLAFHDEDRHVACSRVVTLRE